MKVKVGGVSFTRQWEVILMAEMLAMLSLLALSLSVLLDSFGKAREKEKRRWPRRNPHH